MKEDIYVSSVMVAYIFMKDFCNVESDEADGNWMPQDSPNFVAEVEEC